MNFEAVCPIIAELDLSADAKSVLRQNVACGSTWFSTVKDIPFKCTKIKLFRFSRLVLDFFMQGILPYSVSSLGDNFVQCCDGFCRYPCTGWFDFLSVS